MAEKEMSPALELSGVKLLALDLDGTVIHGNVSAHFGKYLYSTERFISFWGVMRLVSFYAKHKMGWKSLRELHENSLNSLFLGRRAQRFEESADRFVASETTKWVRDSLRAVIDRAKKMEIPLAIFSSSPRFLVQRVAHTLEIPHVYATDYSIDSTGCFSGLGELMDAHAKCKHLQTLTSSLGISRGDVMTFSDDLIDLPFLEAGGRVCVVDPARKLRKLASARGWVAIDE